MFGLFKSKPAPVGPHPFEIEAKIAASAADVFALIDFADPRNAMVARGCTVEAVEGPGQRFLMKVPQVPDLDFHLDESEKPAPMQTASSTHSQPFGAKRAESHARPELDKLDFEFNDDHATFEDRTPSVLEGQWHDSATKLDLAKAYQEMGDVEGAREILREVLAEGDSEQKTEAQALIAKLP